MKNHTKGSDENALWTREILSLGYSRYSVDSKRTDYKTKRCGLRKNLCVSLYQNLVLILSRVTFLGSVVNREKTDFGPEHGSYRNAP